MNKFIAVLFICLSISACSGNVEVTSEGADTYEKSKCVSKQEPISICGCETVEYVHCENGVWYIDTGDLWLFCDSDPSVTSNCFTPKQNLKYHCGC